MSLIKSFSVGNGDMYYIDHNSDNFTTIDCCYCDEENKILTIYNRVVNKFSIYGCILNH